MFKKLRKKFWPKPYALPSRRFTPDTKEFTWEDWKEKAKKEKPIRFFIFETLNFEVSFFFEKYFSMPIRKFVSIHLKKDHLIDLRAVGFDFHYDWGYVEPDLIILRAPVIGLNKFISDFEKNRGPLINYIHEVEQNEDNPHDQKLCIALRKAIQLHNWFNYEYRALDTKVGNMLSNKPDGFKHIDYWNAVEELQLMYNQKLKELIDISEYLWV